jgi:opacity protein-like surface antigen
MKRFGLLCAFVLLIGTVSTARAIDHKNLDEGRPVRLQDAYPVAQGELALESGVGYIFKRKAKDHGFLDLDIVYGAFANMQLELGTTLFTNPREIDEAEKSGDLTLSALYNFNQETLQFPALGIKGSVNFPTGVDSAGVDFELTGLITKSIGRLSLHLNGGYEFVTGEKEDERSARYKIAFGPSYPLGAPMHTRTTLVADLFVEQSAHHGEDETFGAEAGVRYQFSERVVLDVGVGSEITGPRDRSPFFTTAGFSYAF